MTTQTAAPTIEVHKCSAVFARLYVDGKHLYTASKSVARGWVVQHVGEHVETRVAADLETLQAAHDAAARHLSASRTVTGGGIDAEAARAAADTLRTQARRARAFAEEAVFDFDREAATKHAAQVEAAAAFLDTFAA